MKKCSRCKIEKDKSEFHFTKTNKDGLSWVCKECNTESNRRYRKENGDKYYFNQQEYRSKPSGFVSQLLYGARTRAEKKGFEFELTNQNIFDLMEKQEMKCAITNVEMTLLSANRKKANAFKCSLDRIDSGKGYTLDNIRLVCWAVNQMKADRTDDEFKEWVKILYKSFQQFT